MLNWFRDLFGLHTIATITADFNATRDRLRAFADKAYKDALDHTVEAAALKKLADDKNAAGDQAHAIADKIAAILT